MHSAAIHCLKLTAHSAQRVVLAGNNNRANHNANHWRARA
jgi:hypothetical protein